VANSPCAWWLAWCSPAWPFPKLRSERQHLLPRIKRDRRRFRAECGRERAGNSLDARAGPRVARVAEIDQERSGHAGSAPFDFQPADHTAQSRGGARWVRCFRPLAPGRWRNRFASGQCGSALQGADARHGARGWGQSRRRAISVPSTLTAIVQGRSARNLKLRSMSASRSPHVSRATSARPRLQAQVERPDDSPGYQPSPRRATAAP
jgi:hypothetical protein